MYFTFGMWGRPLCTDNPFLFKNPEMFFPRNIPLLEKKNVGIFKKKGLIGTQWPTPHAECEIHLRGP
jgi:hypothetical protein